MPPKKTKTPVHDVPVAPHHRIESHGILDYYKVTIPLFSALLWPTVVAVLIMTFKTPLIEAVVQLPGILERSTRITLWDVQLDVAAAIPSDTTPEVAAALSGLSPDAAIYLLRDGEEPGPATEHSLVNCGVSKVEFYSRRSGLQELETRQMLTVSLSQGEDCAHWTWRWTPLGQDAYQALSTIILQQLLVIWEDPA